jgi:hypothetical protein
MATAASGLEVKMSTAVRLLVSSAAVMEKCAGLRYIYTVAEGPMVAREAFSSNDETKKEKETC